MAATGDQCGVEYILEALGFPDAGSNPSQALSMEARFHQLASRHLKAIELLNTRSKIFWGEPSCPPPLSSG